MHLLRAQPGEVSDGTEPVDPRQTPADVVVLSASDTELAMLSEARASMEDPPPLRLAQLGWLAHPYSTDLYLDATATKAKLVVARMIGGEAYWPYAAEQLAARLGAAGVAFAALPGDDRPDEGLRRISTVADADREALWACLVEGGPENARRFLRLCAHLTGRGDRPPAAAPLLRAGLYWPGAEAAALDDLRAEWRPDRPVAALVFYRALLEGAGLHPVNRMVRALMQEGLNPLPVFVASLKDPVSAATVDALFAEAPPAVVLNATSFAVGSADGAERAATPLDRPGAPVLQVVFSGGTEEAWETGLRGLTARDIAMNVALPEIDGRILSRAVSFKGEAYYDEATECPIAAYRAHGGRVAFVARLAANWARLAATPRAERRVAIVLANYPNRDGRLANGVGLDTPASAVRVLGALAGAGYATADLPADAAALMARLTAGPTNWLPDRAEREGGEALPLDAYRRAYTDLPWAVRERIESRWGAPEADPFVEGDAFRLSVHRFGNLVLGLQPSRGYDIDPAETYHSPDLVPPHHYLAFYIWLREAWGCHAVVHLGKHGNLEWLPGKAVALSDECLPEAVLGAMPHLYPFIVNDPGEGTQAKRRAQAAIVDHLTPPLTRAETYGPLRDLEALVDEYYQAAGLDPRRIGHLRREIFALSASSGLDADAGVAEDDDADSRLTKLDDYLCELKESQIRDGLHVFGESPAGRLALDLAVALVRVPRGRGDGRDASLIRALARDLGLDPEAFDPLDCRLGAPWEGPRPGALAAVSDDAWRTNGDTVERLELLAVRLVSSVAERALAGCGGQGAAPAGRRPDTAPGDGRQSAATFHGERRHMPEESAVGAHGGALPADAADWPRTLAVLSELRERVLPALAATGEREIAGLLAGLDGRFVQPGPSGAPTRGRLDVLPTGRNFYSVDSRAVPTPAAWALGWASAERLVERHMQDEGDWLRAVALTAWGTSNMRTGGDDIAQGLALMGVRPQWDNASRRVTGFGIIPLDALARPRVDVTLRVSGFFRDAFPAQIDLFDSAARAVMALDEPADQNPAAARFREEAAAGPDAARRAGFRVFGSKPGAYGAGLQALIDGRNWAEPADLARAYIDWSGYAYGAGAEGDRAEDLLRTRLGEADAVVQNQDNREHDLLDSDDYYQFEGGMTAVVEHVSGRRPRVYHNDHSRPERPVIRTLEEEIGRVVRSRVVNPKWIDGVKRHGYKGAFEMAATVDYLFAFAATTGAVRDHHFDLVHAAFLEDDATRAFIADANPAALREMAERLSEAVGRGLWQPRSNAARDLLARLTTGATT